MVYNKAMQSYYTTLLKQISEKYLTKKEIEYDTKAGLFYSPHDYKNYLEYVDTIVGNTPFKRIIVKLPLKTFNSKHIYYIQNIELMNLMDEYLSLLKEDFDNQSFMSTRLFDSFYKSRIYSEIEGTLNVENVPTTRRRLKQLIEEKADPTEKNDLIIKNMDQAIKFVYEMPEFNKDNLRKLYGILSDGCLDKDDILPDGSYYRDDGVEVDGYNGCPVDRIDECMNSLFEYVNAALKEDKSVTHVYLPHICHYYIAYIHPYFDYNGRTARMVSLWVNLLANHDMIPPLISEAINQYKTQYYESMRNSRDAHNDMTYFIQYLIKLTIKYFLCYRDIEEISQFAKNQNVVLTDTELNYIKRILVSYKGKFSHQDFNKFCRIEISKQGALKILNKFVDLDILVEVETESKVKLFDINKDIVHYTRLENNVERRWEDD